MYIWNKFWSLSQYSKRKETLIKTEKIWEININNLLATLYGVIKTSSPPCLDPESGFRFKFGLKDSNLDSKRLELQLTTKLITSDSHESTARSKKSQSGQRNQSLVQKITAQSNISW